MPPTKKRTRRTPEQMIEDLQKEIERIKTKAAQAKVKKDPALRHVNAAVKSIDKAAAETGDAATKNALGEARATLVACLELAGASAPQAGGRRKGAAVQPEAVLDYLGKNPDSRADEIADELGIDTKTLRPVMKRLIEAKQVRAKGKARGMRYSKC